MRFQTIISLTMSRRRRSWNCEGDSVKKKKKIRAQPQHQYIPEEIVVNLLQKLPVWSLLQFRCVSKQWCDLISRTKTRKHKLLMKSTAPSKPSFQSIDQTTQRDENIVTPKQWQECGYVHFYGSCDGLILVEHYSDLYLWNPSIRYCEKILAHKRLNPHCSKTTGGLFFDSLDNEYKIIVAFSHQTPSYGGEFVMVGSPRNKSWTHIRFPYSIRSIRSGPVLNNCLHWSAAKRGARYCSSSFIIYFDGKSDKFLKLPMPLDKETEGDLILSLAVLDGCLCMSRTDVYGGAKVDVLVMKEYGVKESWAVLFRIDGVSSTYDFHPLFYVDEWRSKVMIHFFQDKETTGTIIVYDTDANSRSELKYIDNVWRRRIVYEETLIRPIRSDWEELDSRGEAFYEEKFRSGRVVTTKRNEDGYWSGGSDDEIYRSDDAIYWEEEEQEEEE